MQNLTPPKLGEDGFIQEPHTLSVVLKCLPREVRTTGSRRQAVSYTCLDVSGKYLALGAEQGYVWILDIHAAKLVRELTDFRGTAITTVALNTQHEHIAFATDDGQTKIDTLTKQMLKGYRILEKDRQSVVAMVWNHVGTTLLCGYSSGKIIKAMFQFTGEVMNVVPLLECGSRVVQLSLCEDNLLISTLARSLLLDLLSGRVMQVGTKERKSGPFGGCVFTKRHSDDEEEEEEEEAAPVLIAYLARPGLRMWTADVTGKVTLTTKFRDPLTSGQFPHIPTNNWSSGSHRFSDSWQFSVVLPWLDGLVVTHHERNLCVLDPSSSTVAGVLSLDRQITCIAVSGKFVYVLCNGLHRPLARFTAHSSYIKNLQKTLKTSGAVTRHDDYDNDDLVSLASTVDGGDARSSTVGDREDSCFSVATRASEESEGFKKESYTTRPRHIDLLTPEVEALLREGEEDVDDSETINPHFPNSITATATSYGGTLVNYIDTPTIQVTHHEDQDQLDRRETLGEVNGGREPSETDRNSPLVVEVSETRDKVEVTVDEEEMLPCLGQVLEEVAPTDNKSEEEDPNRLPDSEENNDRNVLHVTTGTTAPHQHATATGSGRNSTQAQFHDPPSVTGPLGVQDLAREVTDLLRPALGKLSILMKSQDKKKDGGGASSFDPDQTSTIDSEDSSQVENHSETKEKEVEDEKEGGGGGGGGGRGGRGGRGEAHVDHNGRGLSPMLKLRLGGKLGGLISGERDKERDSPFSSASSSGTPGVGVPPTPIGPEEEERRLRMARAVGEEDAVAERLTQRKRRKRRTKKSSSKPSSSSASLERLTDIGDGDGDVTTPADSPQVELEPDHNKAPESIGGLDEDKENILSTKLSALIEKGELMASSSSQGSKLETEQTPNDESDIRQSSQPILQPGTTSTHKPGTATSTHELGTTFPHEPGTTTSTHEPGTISPHEPGTTSPTLLVTESHSHVDTEAPNYNTTDGLSEVISRPRVEDDIIPPSSTSTENVQLLTDISTDSSSKDLPQEKDDEREKDEIRNPSNQESRRELFSPDAASKTHLLDSIEVTLGNDPLSQLQEDEDNTYHKVSTTVIGMREKEEKQSEQEPGGRLGQMVSGGEEDVPLELSDNPLYGDDTSDFTTDTDSSQQRSRCSSSAGKLQTSGTIIPVPPAPSSSSSSSMSSAKNPQSKAAVTTAAPSSLGLSPGSSELCWDSTLHVRRPRSDRVFTPSVSPFEASDSPSSSYHSSSSNTLQAPRGKAPQATASLPSSLLFQDSSRQQGGGDESGSEFSGDEENECEAPEEKFSLCAAAVSERRTSPGNAAMRSAMRSPSPLISSLPRSLTSPADRSRGRGDRGMQHRVQEEGSETAAETAASSFDPDADIWVTVPHPCRGHAQSICVSDHLLWLVDSRHLVYCTEINTKGKKWELIKHQMQQVSSSPSGSIVWGVYRHNAYMRHGVNEMNRVGNGWFNITKGTSLVQKIKSICVDEEGVWVVRTDGQIVFRKGVTPNAPQGRVWVEVGRAAGFTSVAAGSGVVWATNAAGRLFYREGVTEQNPSGRKWSDMKAPPLEAVCMTQGNVAWIIDGEGKMGFRGGVSRAQPTGKNPWWEVTVSTTLSHGSLPFNSLWQVMTSEGSQFLSSVSSLIHTHLPGHHKHLLAVSASNRAGVCVLESGSKLHACWRSTTGYHYSSASKDGVFQLTTWTMFGSGSTGLWVVRDDGELYCVTPQDRFVRIECASTVQMMTVSSTALWVIANNQLWSRQGMTTTIPEGISWDYIELSPHLHQRKLKHIVCGKRAVWAVDGTGVPHFRFGVHSREPGTGMSPAWVPVDDLSHPLQQITVSNNDWLVWAVDENFNSYVRTEVTPDFPIGRAWDVIPGQSVKQLCAHGRKVYALTPSGNLLCRYGITETNVQGNYWRQLPGNFVQIAIGHSGVLLGLDSKGSILKQQCKTLSVVQDSEFFMHQFEGCLDNSWEVV